MFHLLCCLRQFFSAISAFQWFISPSADFLSLVRVTQFSQFEKGILCPKSCVHQMEVFSGYSMTVKRYI